MPERVTEIAVEEEEAEEGRSSFRNGVVANAASTSSVRLKYKITVFDPVFTVKSIRAQLMQAAADGSMGTSMRTYAAQFGATGLVNATVAEPQVTSATVQRNDSEQLTGVQIALVVIGVVVGLGLVAGFVYVAMRISKQKLPAPAAGHSAL